MKIAVTYDNGQVFQHFGHCEQFKVYTVQDKKVTETEIVGSNGSGHSALADLLNNIKVDVLICGRSRRMCCCCSCRIRYRTLCRSTG